MRKKLFIQHNRFQYGGILIFFVSLIFIVSSSAVFGEDRLIIKDDSGNTTYKVDHTGIINSTYVDANDVGDGLAQMLILSASNASATALTSDAGFTLTNAVLGFSWAFRTYEPGTGFAFTKVGTGGTELSIRNTSASYTGVSMLLGNGASCTSAGVWTNASSRDYKENIQEISKEEAFNSLKTLNPVKFNVKSDPDNEKYLGFIAEDVPELVAMKDRKSMSSMDVVALLTKVVKEQQKTIEELAAKIAKIENK
jgi:hypothetical protein